MPQGLGPCSLCFHWGHGKIWVKLPLRAMSRPIVLLQLGCMMSMAHLAEVGHRNHVFWNPRSMLSWSHHLLALFLDAAIELFPTPMEELCRTLRKDGPTPHHRPRNAGSALPPSVRGTVPVAWIDHLSYHSYTYPGPSISPSSHLHHIWPRTITTGSPWLGATAGYLRRVSLRVQWRWCARPMTHCNEHWVGRHDLTDWL